MLGKKRILIINTGVQSIKIAIFDEDKVVFNKTIREQKVQPINDYITLQKQLTATKQRLLLQLKKAKIEMKSIDLIVSNTGYIQPVKSGAYTINEAMVSDLIEHSFYEAEGSFGAILAHSLAEYYQVPAITYDPPTVDELQDVARVSGHPDFVRRSYFNALNQKAVGRHIAKKIGTTYEEAKFIIVHLGSAVSVGAHENGKVIDVNNGYYGEGPFSTIRTGSLPMEAVIKKYIASPEEVKELPLILKQGGFLGYLGTDSLTDVEWRIVEDDQEAIAIYDAMTYQIAKEIGAYATVLKGNVDAVILTGGMSISPFLVKKISEYIKWIAPIHIVEDQLEMQTLSQVGLRVLNNEEEVMMYTSCDAKRHK